MAHFAVSVSSRKEREGERKRETSFDVFCTSLCLCKLMREIDRWNRARESIIRLLCRIIGLLINFRTRLLTFGDCGRVKRTAANVSRTKGRGFVNKQIKHARLISVRQASFSFLQKKGLNSSLLTLIYECQFTLLNYLEIKHRKQILLPVKCIKFLFLHILKEEFGTIYNHFTLDLRDLFEIRGIEVYYVWPLFHLILHTHCIFLER